MEETNTLVEVPPTEATEPATEETSTVERADGAKLEGECKWFHFSKGFGFLQNISDGGEEIYVHHTDIKGFACLIQGQKVEFIYKTVAEKGGKLTGRSTSVTGPGGVDITNHGSLRNTAHVKKLEANPLIKLGNCKWFDPTKGYGFITPVDGSEDIFVHSGSLNVGGAKLTTKLPAGMDMEYQLSTEAGTAEQKEDGKLRALNVTGVGGAPLDPFGPATAPLPYMQATHTVQSVLGKRPAPGQERPFAMQQPPMLGQIPRLGARGPMLPQSGLLASQQQQQQLQQQQFQQQQQQFQQPQYGYPSMGGMQPGMQQVMQPGMMQPGMMQPGMMQQGYGMAQPQYRY